MASINLQFHATQDEMIEVIKKAIFENELFLVSSQLFQEFTCELIGVEEFDEKINLMKRSNMIFLYKYKPDLSQKGYMEYLKSNNDFLLFEIENQSEDALKEFRVCTITNDSETFKIWRKIVNRFKRSLLKGAWIFDPLTGNKQYFKNHYYTFAAKKAFEAGIKIVPFAGSYEFILNEII